MNFWAVAIPIVILLWLIVFFLKNKGNGKNNA